MADLRKMLKARQKTHGDWTDSAACCQRILRAMMAAPNWDKLTDVQKESLHMIAHKIQRIVVGDPNQRDHWDDIAGYATIAADRLKKR